MTSKRVTLVTDELLGYVRTGGIGTATSFLAIALARMGHRVEVLYVGPAPNAAPSSEWASLYHEVDLTIRHPPPTLDRVEPPYFAQMRSTESALAAQPPDVVIAQDLAAPAYTALRLRRLGLAFEDTLFVVVCHGTRRWITDTARKVRVLPNAHAITVLEQASVELADAVVSPSRYLLEWMEEQGWRLPKSSVIPWFTRWAAAGESPPRAPKSLNGGVRRISFFGRLEERKGIGPFVEALNALDPALLEGLELYFLGRATPAWTPERIRTLLSNNVRDALRRLSFETELDQHDALERLTRPGTLAMLPSFGETFGNAVRECLDRGIPFRASNAGAIPELVAQEDWERVLFEPTPAGIADALRRALSSPDALVPARAVFDEKASWEGWRELLDTTASVRPTQRSDEDIDVDVVLLQRTSQRALERCLSALAAQTYPRFSAIVVTSPDARAALASQPLPLSPLVIATEDASRAGLREAGVRAGRSPWVMFLDAEDVPEPGLLEMLVRAQVATGADVVGCGLSRSGTDRATVHFFAGEPRGLGVLANAYGRMALLRRSLLTSVSPAPGPEGDHDWALLAGLSLSGAQIVSVPIPLITTSAAAGDPASDPATALHVAQLFESALSETLRPLARLAAGLEAEAARGHESMPPRLLRRVLHRLAGSRT